MTNTVVVSRLRSRRYGRKTERNGDDGPIRQSIRATVPPFRRSYETCGFATLRTVSISDDVERGDARSAAAIRDDPRRERKATRDRYFKPTLRQAWPREYPRPQYAFKISMFNVSCNSHYFTQLAALFIDTRAE
jgi:hypothetical protein